MTHDEDHDDKTDPLATAMNLAVKQHKTSSGSMRAVLSTSKLEATAEIEEVDPDKALVLAIRDIVDANTKLIRTVQRNEIAQEGMRRRLATMTRVVAVAGAFVVVCTVGLGMAAHRLSGELTQAQDDLAALRITTAKTLRAVSLGTHALATKVEADSRMTPEADERMRRAAVAAQKAALEAEAATTAAAPEGSARP